MRKIISAAACGIALLSTGMAPADAATPAKRLANVRVPAYCEMPATRLHNNATPRKFAPRGGYIVVDGNYLATPLAVHLRKHGTQLLAQYLCSAGGVSWPTVLVLYDKHNRLISSLRLARYAPNDEHSGVDHWTRSGHHVDVAWTAYQGAGFEIRHHRSRLVLRHGQLAFA